MFLYINLFWAPVKVHSSHRFVTQTEMIVSRAQIICPRVCSLLIYYFPFKKFLPYWARGPQKNRILESPIILSMS